MAITTVARLNAYLGETTTTDAKTYAVAAACDIVQQVTGQTFDSQELHDWYYVRGSQLTLREMPVTAVHLVATGAQDALSLTWTGSGLYAQATVHDGGLTVRPATSSDTATFTLADYTSSTLVTALAAEGWTATALIDFDPQSLKPASTSGCLSPSVAYLQAPDEPIEIEDIDYRTGLLTLSTGGVGWVYVHYSSGYSSVPAGVAQIATEIAASILSSAGVNRSLKSESLGDYSYTVGETNTDYIQPLIERLSVYRKPTL